MPAVPAFHSIHEANKPAGKGVYHTNSLCALGRAIPTADRRAGTAGYQLCVHCADYNRLGR
jgi:hypothetical protein